MEPHVSDTGQAIVVAALLPGAARTRHDRTAAGLTSGNGDDDPGAAHDAGTAPAGTEHDTLVVKAFPDAAKAMECALELRLHSARAGDGLPLARIGVAGGTCRTGAGEDPEGPAVERAIGLARASSSGEFLVSDEVRERLGASAEPLLTDPSSQDRTGLHAWRRTWPAVTGTIPQPPLPGNLRAARRPWGMFGRTRALRRIENAWLRARNGTRSLVLVSGEAGIGKTRLVSEAAFAAHQAGAVVLYARHDTDHDTLRQGVPEAVEQLIRHLPRDVLAEVPHAVAVLGDLAGSLSAAATRRPDARDPGAHHVLFGAVTSVLSAVATRRPLMVVIDDLHAADRAGLMLLRHLLLGPALLPALVIGTYRPAEMSDRGGERLADLSARLAADHLELTGLAEEDLAGLVEQLAPSAARRRKALGRALATDTGGNPLFATEVLRSAAESGDGPAVGNGGASDTAGELPVPRSVQAVIAARARRLGPQAERTLAMAAVSGMDVDASLLAVALDEPETEVTHALDIAERAGLLESGAPGRYRFAHPMVQRSLREGISPAERGSAHHALANALHARVDSGVPVDPGELARHFSLARPPAPARAVTWARRAGAAALDRFRPEQAARWFTRALELGERAGELDLAARCDLLLSLGAAQRHAGDPEFRATLLRAGQLARQLGEGDRLVAAALANTRGLTSQAGSVDHERVALLERALVSSSAKLPKRATLLAALAEELTFSDQHARRVELSDEAVETAMRSGDQTALANVLIARFMTTWAPDTLPQRLADIERGVKVAEGLDDPLTLFHALHWQTVALVQAGQVDEAQLVQQRGEELARRAGDATARWIATLDRGNLALIAGRLTEAERLAHRSLDLGTETGQPDALTFHASQIACVRWEQGRLAELLDMMEAAVHHNPGVPAFRSLLALVRVEAGARDEARELLRDAVVDGSIRLPCDPAWLAGAVTYAHVAAELDDVETAETLYTLLAPFGDQIVYTAISVWGDVAWALGRLAATLGRHADARRHLEASIARSTRIGAPIWRARTEVSLAALLLRDPAYERAKARALLERAAAAAARAGAGAVERKARILAAAPYDSAQDHAPPAPRRVGTLTERQTDIVRLAAQGQSNAEIAAALGISPATVKRHLERTYRALGVGTRAAAVAWLLREESRTRSGQ